jgi:hypothetical protein
MEYEIRNITEAEIVNLDLFDMAEEEQILKGFIEEIGYWNPHIAKIVYNEIVNSKVYSDTLIKSGFIKDTVWTYSIPDAVEVFKIGLKHIAPEQLTVDEEKLKRVSSWIEVPEDVIICCVKINDKTVSIDGHSRLVAALRKGFEHVYAFYDPSDNDIEFFKNCLKWCEDENIYSIYDLSERVVSPEEHQRLWCDRCQKYLKEHR